jgi:hypothetical protein
MNGSKKFYFFSIISLLILLGVLVLTIKLMGVQYGNPSVNISKDPDEIPINVHWCVILIPLIFEFFIIGRIFDALLEGRISGKIGGMFKSLGLTSLGASLEKLNKLYDEPKFLDSEYKSMGGNCSELVGKRTFAKWMIAEIVPRYENNVQAMAFWGAAILIVLIGLRGVKLYITKEDPSLLLVGLELECVLLGLLGAILFYKPESLEHAPHRGGTPPGISQLLEVRLVDEQIPLTVKLAPEHVITIRSADTPPPIQPPPNSQNNTK